MLLAAAGEEDCKAHKEDGALQPQEWECGGKRSATPLWEPRPSRESGVAAALCHRTPYRCRPGAKWSDCSTGEASHFDFDRDSSCGRASALRTAAMAICRSASASARRTVFLVGLTVLLA